MAADGTLNIPKPGPEDATIVVCDGDGAFAWVKLRKTDLAEPGIVNAIPGLLAEAQDKLREDRDAEGRDHG